jgi:putative NADPH-quinone reductase
MQGRCRIPAVTDVRIVGRPSGPSAADFQTLPAGFHAPIVARSLDFPRLLKRRFGMLSAVLSVQDATRNMAGKISEIALIQGHPDCERSHFGHALADAYADGAREVSHIVHTIDVAALSFPFLRSREDLERGAPPPAIANAQRLIGQADHIVMLYPVWNGAMPALLKAFLEQVFRPAFTFVHFNPDEPLGFRSALRQPKRLTGKTARIVATMQMPAWIYRWWFHPRPDKTPFRLAGVRPIRESLIGLVETPDRAARERWIGTMRELGAEAR